MSLDYLARRINHRLSFSAEPMTTDRLKIAEMYAVHSEKNNGKLELFAEQLLMQQKNSERK